MLLPLSNDLRNETLMPEKHENEKPKKGALDRELVMTQNFTNFMTFLVLTPIFTTFLVMTQNFTNFMKISQIS